MRAVYHSLLHLINHINKLMNCSHFSDKQLLEPLDECFYEESFSPCERFPLQKKIERNWAHWKTCMNIDFE